MTTKNLTIFYKTPKLLLRLWIILIILLGCIESVMAFPKDPPPPPSTRVDFYSLMEQEMIISPIEGFFWIPLDELGEASFDSNNRLIGNDVTVILTSLNDDEMEPITGAVYRTGKSTSLRRLLYWRAEQVMEPSNYTLEIRNNQDPYGSSYFVERSFTLQVLDTSEATGELNVEFEFMGGTAQFAGDLKYLTCCEDCRSNQSCTDRCLFSESLANSQGRVRADTRSGYESYTLIWVNDQKFFADRLNPEMPFQEQSYVSDNFMDELCFTPYGEDYASQLSFEGEPTCVSIDEFQVKEPIETPVEELAAQTQICMDDMAMNEDLESDNGCDANRNQKQPFMFFVVLVSMGLIARRKKSTIIK